MREAFAVVYGRYDSLAGRVLGPVVAPRTYLRALHLLVAFPLGVAYVVTLTLGLAVGGALVWTLVGPVVLVALLYLAGWAADMEAWLVRAVARVEAPRGSPGSPAGESWRSRLRARLSERSTWTGLAYLLLQGPLGLGGFVAVTVLGAVSLGLLTGPLVVWIGQAASGDDRTELWDGGPGFDTPGDAWWLVPLGVVAVVIAAHAICALSACHAAWARLMLTRASLPEQESRVPREPRAVEARR